MIKKLTNKITYIGVDDKTLDLFEGQYIIPNGISYNSYLIDDEKSVIMDTVDIHKGDEWFDNLTTVLNGKSADYLIVSHMEPDHAGNIERFLKTYPNSKVIGNDKTFTYMKQFFPNLNLTDRTITVKDGDTFSFGQTNLTFIFAPMIHWPEVMMTYNTTDKILFSADAFGKFGTLDTDEEWDCEARRYYINIVGKYGYQVQILLQKAQNLDIQKIFPLHGPMLTEDLPYYINKYNIWSSYTPETKGIFIAYTSIYGHTRQAALLLKEELEKSGQTLEISDLARDDIAEAVENAFRYDRMVLACPTYDGGLFPPMDNFLNRLISKNFQNRKIGIIENGTWAPISGKKMMDKLQDLKGITFCHQKVQIKSALNEKSLQELKELSKELCE